MSFWLSDTPDERLRLKKFSSSSTGGKSTITIVIETADPYQLGYALERLTKVQKGQNAKPKPVPKVAPKEPLALPAPLPALPRT